jgi:hypothetical protein
MPFLNPVNLKPEDLVRRDVCRPSLPTRGNAPLQPLRRAALGFHRRWASLALPFVE